MFNIAGFSVTLLQIVATVFGAGILVFVHELGHFMMAKKYKLKVEKFAFGFGPELYGFTKGETRYSICAIPLGGMVKMPGEDINSTTGSPDEFYSQAWNVRFMIAFFGPLMNYLLAILIFGFVIYTWGLSKPSELPFIGEVLQDYPASKAGIQAGDRVEKINGVKINNWIELAGYIHTHSDKELAFNIKRNEKDIVIKVVPKMDKESKRGLIGIAPQVEIEKMAFFSSFGLGTKMVIFQSVFTLEYLWDKMMHFEKPDVAGPIGVVQFLAKAAKSGWKDMLHLLAVISTALGLFNLLPIPILDGGHIFISLIEAVTRRQLSKKIIQNANMVGLTIIVFIFLLATYNDITRLFN